MNTNLELHLSAASAAQASLDIKTEFDADAAAMKSFSDLKLDQLDWPAFKNFFWERRREYQKLASQTPLSVITAQRMKGRVLPAPEPKNPPGSSAPAKP